MESGYVGWANLALKAISVLHTKDLRRVPSIAANTSEVVQVILVEDLGRGNMSRLKLIQCTFTFSARIQECGHLIYLTHNEATKQSFHIFFEKFVINKKYIRKTKNYESR